MKKILRIVSLVILIIIILIAIIASVNKKPSNAEKVWDLQTTVGDPEAKNYFIVYSDIMCPYCVAFENAIFENEEAFKAYIAENDILLEIRLSDFLYEYGEARAINSRYSALGAYCAKNEGRFWDYYKLAITTVWNDYFKTSGKSAFNTLNSFDKSYWINLGKQLGLDENFENCVNNEDPLPEIKENAKRTRQLADGMPYFKFNQLAIPGGFNLNDDWNDVLMMFQAGLEN